MNDEDREEFRAYVAARGPALLRSAVLLTGDRGHAEDLVQTALVRTYGAWGRIRRREAVDAYTRRVLVTTTTCPTARSPRSSAARPARSAASPPGRRPSCAPTTPCPP